MANGNHRNGRTGNGNGGKQQSAFDRIGCLISSFVADIAATPLAQILVVVVCAAWFMGGFATDLLTAILSILAITLTQMVLNQQKDREIDAHRRDVAMHAKLDELLVAVRGARNEMAGIEELDEDEIEELKIDAMEAIDAAGDAAGDKEDRAAAKKVIDAAHRHQERKRAKGRKAG